MKKIYLRTMVAALLLLCSTVASAEDVLIDGINYYIDTNSNTATVITGSEKNTGDIDIPAEIVYNGTICSVTAIGSDAFYECRDITSITIPNSVTSIERSAFSHCSGLTNITIPDNVASIGDYAFYECTGLASITISKSVTTIGHWAFNSCRGLKSITVNSGNTVYDSRNNCNAIIKTATNKLIQGCNNSVIPNSVTSIEEYAFSRCESLSSIEIPNSVTTIGDYAFQCCYGLTSITIPNSITTIENNVLEYCTSLKNITIPNSVTTIKSAAFWGCESLTSIEIPNSVTIIGSEVFHLCKSLKSITIPNSVTSIGGGLFYKCTDLASITVENGNTVYDSRENCNAIIETQTNTLIAGCKRTIIPSDITKINDNAFWNCTGLTSIKIPGSVTAIGNYAFNGCTGLTSVTIPNSVTNIGDYAFSNCTDLTDVYCHATTVPETSSNAFNNSNATNATLHVPATAIESYRATAPWSNFGTIVAIEGSEENKNLLDLGACGDNLTCAIDTVENKLYINGTGDMYDFDYNNHAPWYNYRIEITSVSINDGVTTIGAHAFDYCIGLTSVTIPNSVTSIGDRAFLNCKGLTSIIVEEGNAVYDSRENCNAIIETQTNTLIRGCKSTTIPGSITTIEGYAFSNCTGLTSITIPSSVTSIGVQAFSGCYGLTSIVVDKDNSIYDSRDNCNAIIETQTNTLIIGRKSTIIPNSVTTIGREAFLYCTGLTTITIPNSVTAIGNYAFRGCTDLTSVTIPNSVTTIEHGAFEDCTGLTSVEIPSSVTNIGSWAFAWCTGLTSITIPNSVTTIGDHAFYNCTRLTSVTIPNSVTTIESGAFSGCTGITSVKIPNSVITIERGAFYKCTGLTSVTIPNSVTTIGSGAFEGCTGLTSVTIPNSVTTIGGFAFYNCTGLTTITIPNSVTTIGDYAFGDCTGLTDVYCHATTVPETSSNAFNNSNATNATLHVPATAIESYRATAPWSDFGTIVAIEGSEENKNLLDLGACGDNLTCAIDTVENKLYINGTGDMYDFDYNNYAPWYNYRGEITSVSINDGVTTIGAHAFDYCYGITSITIPNSVTTIGENAFYKCTGLTSVTIPNSVTTIGDYAFSDCTGLTSITIGNSVTTIEFHAFSGCTGLTSVTIPNSVTTIGSGAFYGCTGLTSIKIPNSVITIGYEAFNNCTGLTSVTIPNSVTIIGDWTFEDCTGLTSVTIPNSVTTIGDYAFSNCTGLTNVYCLATTVPETNSNAFNNSNAANATLHVPATAIESYRTTAPWSEFGTIVAIEGSEEDGDEPSITTGEAIDLGLPSGIKWASCNIGATAPEEYGGYYAWGETEEKDSYDWGTYKWCNGTKYSMTKYCTNSNYGTVDNKTTLDPKDDVAHVKWGGNWRMPTLTEQQELIDNCVWVWTTINDVIGYNVTGPNGNSIFMPAAGFRSQKATKAQGSAAHYWTGSLNGDNSSAFAFYFYNKGHRCISNYRDRGHTVRPVYDDGSSTSIEIITPEVNNENTIYDLRGQKLTEITAPGIYIVNGKKVIVK